MESKFCGIHMKDHNIFSEDRMVAYMIPNTLHLTAGLGLEPGEIYPSSFIQMVSEKRKSCSGKILERTLSYTSRMNKPYPWQFEANFFRRQFDIRVS